MTTAVLICEGACNHYETARIDKELVDSAKRREHEGGVGVTGTENLWRRIRALTYTTHELVGTRYARCTKCRWVRIWGWRDTFVTDTERTVVESGPLVDAAVIAALAPAVMTAFDSMIEGFIKQHVADGDETKDKS